MNRYNEDFFYKNGEADFTMKKVDGGRWVKFSDVEPLIEALKNIRDEDYRGNRPHSAVIAFEALKKAGVENG